MVRKKESLIWEGLYFFSSIFFLALIFFVLYNSLNYLTNNYPSTANVENQMFYISVMIAIVSVHAQWMEGRIKSIMESTQLFSRRYKEWRTKKNTQE